MIEELLWVLWTIGQVAAVMIGWFVILLVVRGLLRGARQAVREHRRGETSTRGG